MKGMIEDMANLVCTAGHKHYSPMPEAFEGKTCQSILANSKPGRPKTCQKRLERIPEKGKKK